jgi:hypothetical protein
MTSSRIQRDKQQATSAQPGSAQTTTISSSPSAPTTSNFAPHAPPTQAVPTSHPHSPQTATPSAPIPATAQPGLAHSSIPAAPPAAQPPARSQGTPVPKARPAHRPSISLMGDDNPDVPILDEATIRAAAMHMNTEQRDAFVGQQKARMAAMQQAAASNRDRQGQSQAQSSTIRGTDGNLQPLRQLSTGGGEHQPRQAARPTGANGPPQTAQVAPGPTHPAQSHFDHNTGTPAVTTAQAPVPQVMGPQRKQFIQSLLSYHKQMGQTPPPEVYSGPLPGAIQMGPYTVELVDLFMTIMRQAGGQAGVSLSAPQRSAARCSVLTRR